MQTTPDSTTTTLPKVHDGCVTSRQERLASIKALKGGNAIAAYLRCKHCTEANPQREHQLVGITEVTENDESSDTRTQHMVCTACAKVEHVLPPLPACPFREGVFEDEAKIQEQSHTALQGELSWGQFMRLRSRAKSGKSPGTDGFTAELLKLAPLDHLRAIFGLLNIFLTGGGIPHNMNGALAILLLKKEPKEDLRNHRPVCLMHVARN